MKKRILSMVMALALCLALLPATAWAEGGEGTGETGTTTGSWADSADTSWYNTTDTAFTLTTAEQLAGLAKLVNNSNMDNRVLFSGKTVYLDEDIDLGGKDWTPIGNGQSIIEYMTVAFQGTFDGRGHTVSNLSINISSDSASVYAGLFGYVGGTVKNLNVSGTVNVSTDNVYSGAYVGGVVAYSSNNSTVENCSFSGDVTSDFSASGNPTIPAAGGVVGYNSKGTVKNCYHTGSVTGNSNGNRFVGGVVGCNQYASTVENCYHTGTVEGTGTGTNVYTGGVVGYNNNNSYSGAGTVSNCYFLQEEGGTLSGIGANLGTSTNVASKTADKFASGEVAWLLSGGENQDATSPWRQNLGDAGDTAPTLDSTHAQVVKLGDAYANTSTGDDGTTCYLIYTAEQLKAFASAVNGGKTSINAKLMNNIDLSTVCSETLGSWTPIGNSSSTSNSFQGTFDGQGHTVSGLYMDITRTGNYSTYGGLFGYVYGGTVKNLNVNGTVTVTNKDSNFVYVGGVVGYADGPSGALSTVENCSFAGEVTGTSGYSIYVGGVVGPADKATVRGCSNSGTVTANGQDYSYAGGVVGRAYKNTTVENCYNTGAVTGTGSDTFYVGGVAGYIYYTTTVENCYNTGDVTGPSGGNVGGVVGGAGYAVNYPSTVENCYFLQDTGTNTGLSGIGYDETSYTSGESSNVGATPKTEDEFASGEVAHLLQNGQEGTVWVQNIGKDSAPALYALLSEGDRAASTVYQVTFVAEAGETESTYAYANSGGTVSQPTVSPKEGYALEGWYTSEEYAQEWNFSTNTVTTDVTLYAKWVAVHTVTFNSQGGADVDSQSVANGGTAAKPADPARDGYTFAGWYTDKECTTAYEFGTAVTADITLYAKWTVNNRPDDTPVYVPTYPPAVEDADNGTVSVVPANPRQGSTVTVTPNPDKGYEVDSITVTDSKGNPVAVTDNGDGTYSFTQPAGKVTISVSYVCDGLTDNCPSYHLADVDTTKWYHLAVDFVVENGLMNGYGNGSFGPNDTLTRAELAQILYNKEERPAVTGGSVFTDVAENAWYADAVTWANRNGIVGGYGSGRFGPNDPITREQLAVMLWRYAGCPAATQKELRFTDADQVSPWALEAMLWATENGVMNGYNGILNPRGTATRAEAAQMLKNFIENI